MNKYLLALALPLTVGLVACDSDSDSQGTPMSPPAETSHSIGMSSTNAVLYDFNELTIGPDTITFTHDDWTLTNIGFNNLSKMFVVDLKGNAPFETECDWLGLKYADRQLIITPLTRFESPDNKEDDYRQAYMWFENSDTTQMLTCTQPAQPAIGGERENFFRPCDLVFSREGGSVSCVSSSPTYVPKSVTLDDTEYTIIDDETIEGYKHLPPSEWDGFVHTHYDFSHDWFHCERDADNMKMMHITLSPNHTGRVRTFVLTFDLLGMHPTYRTIVGLQLAD